VITSRGTMDKSSSNIRKALAENADLIGAIRLPNSAFKSHAGTEVVSDIIFLQRRASDTPMSEQTKAFISAAEYSREDLGNETYQTSVNQYFIDHPEMVLGNPTFRSGPHGMEYTIESDPNVSLKEALDQAIARLPAGIMRVITKERTDAITENNTKALEHRDDLSPGTIRVEGSQVYVKGLDGQYLDSELSGKAQARVIALCTMRDTFHEALLANQFGQDIHANTKLKELNTLYDQFISEYGYINKASNTRDFQSDPDITLLQALEDWDPVEKLGKKSDLLKELSFHREVSEADIRTASDALAASLTQFGQVNLPYMADLLHTEEDELTQNLLNSGEIYLDHEAMLRSGGAHYIESARYLSGNIREKTRRAEQAELQYPGQFTGNIAALGEKTPHWVAAEDIHVAINSPLVTTDDIHTFLTEVMEARWISVKHVKELGKWDFSGYIPHGMATSKYGTSAMPAGDLIVKVLNNSPIQVYDTDIDGKKILNQDATYAAQMKAEEIHAAFAGWIYKDPERTERIEALYNEVFNSVIEADYTHPARKNNPDAKIYLPGSSFPHPLREHQADAIWRIVQEKNVMLNHVVGAGKTLEISGASMEMNRLGVRTKQMIVVPDNMLDQWTAAFRLAYPGAKILAGNDSQIKDRALFTNKIVTGNWDAIIIRSRTFTDIPMSTQAFNSYFHEKIRELRTVLEAHDNLSGRTLSQKQIEKKIASYETRLERLTDKVSELEGVIPFDQLGIDQLYVDEAHLFKNLEYTTSMSDVRGMGTQTGSQRAFDMHMKVESIQKAGGGVVFATGTAISNTLVESYTMMRYLQNHSLKAMGISHFDEWARMFAKTSQNLELNATGTSYKVVTRFTSIQNVPELMRMLRTTWDIQTSKNLEERGILVHGQNLPIVNTQKIVVEKHPLMQSYMRYLDRREADLKLTNTRMSGSDNILVIMNDGMKAAIDLRMIHPDLPKYQSKVEEVASQLISRYREYDDQKLTQVVFVNKPRSYWGGEVSFDAVTLIARRLTDAGIPASHIADMRDHKTDGKKQNIYNQMNSSDIRILFGSGMSLGAGVNVQRKLKAIHIVDPDYRPADIAQKIGRIDRQGNTNDEVDVLMYATAGSLDTGMYSLLETKAKSTEMVISGYDEASREISENVFGSIKELSTENPDIRKMFEVESDIKRLLAQRKNHYQDVADAARWLESYPQKTGRIEENIAKLKHDIAIRKPEEPKKDQWEFQGFGRAFKSKKEAGEAIVEKAQQEWERWQKGNRNIRTEGIGTYRGYTLSADIDSSDILKGSVYHVKVQADYFTARIPIYNESDPSHVFSQITRVINNGPDRELGYQTSMLESYTSQLGTYQELSSAAFPKAGDLNSLIDEREVLQKRIDAYNEQEMKANRTHDFPWEEVHTLSTHAIQEAVEVFMREEALLGVTVAQRDPEGYDNQSPPPLIRLFIQQMSVVDDQRIKEIIEDPRLTLISKTEEVLSHMEAHYQLKEQSIESEKDIQRLAQRISLLAQQAPAFER
jgi:N12 class adenine-specific DNA methylase